MMRRWITPLVYFGLAMALLWPASLPGSDMVPGGARTDVWNSIWSMWFAQTSFASGTLPWATDLLNHPNGGTVLLPDALGAIFAALTIPSLGTSGAYTGWILLQLCLSGLIAHRFAADWLTTTGLDADVSHRAGWVAGVSYISAPVLLAGVQCGTTEAVGGAWPALAAWMIWRSANGLGTHSALRAAVALLLAAVASWYAAVVAFVFAAILALTGTRIGWKHRLWPLAAGLLLVIPFALFTQSTHSDAAHLGTRSLEILQHIRESFGAADLHGMLFGSDRSDIAIMGPNERGQGYLHTAYLGWVLTAAAAVALTRRIPGGWAIAAAGTVCAALALGPNIHWNGEILTTMGPYRLIEDLPGFNGLSLLWRLGIGASLALSLLAAATTRGHRAAVIALCALILAEVQLVSPAGGPIASSDTSNPSALLTLRDAPAGAVITIPAIHQHADLWRQTIHHHPVTGTINHRRSSDATNWIGGLGWYRTHTEKPGHGHTARRFPRWTWPEIEANARKLDVRYIIVFGGGALRDSYESAVAERLKEELEPLAEHNRMRIYKLW